MSRPPASIMNLLLFLTVIFSFSLVSASETEDQKVLKLTGDIPDNLPHSHSHSPSSTRHRSLTQYKPPQLSLINPDTINSNEQIHKSPTTISSTMSVDFIQIPAVQSDKKTSFVSNHFKSFASNHFKSFDKSFASNYFKFYASKSSFVHPSRSSIIAQLNVLDHLMSSAQFPQTDKPASLMADHLALLNSRCRHLAAIYGPLHLKYRNCVFRYHEFTRFFKLLTKYKTSFPHPPKNRNSDFCAKFFAGLLGLQKLTSSAVRKYSHLAQLTTKFDHELAAQLDAHRKEISQLESAIESFDLDMRLFCELETSDHSSYHSARETILNFLNLAFI